MKTKNTLISEAVARMGYTSTEIKINGSICQVSTKENETLSIYIFERHRQQADDPCFSLSQEGVTMAKAAKCNLVANLYGNIACCIVALDMPDIKSRDEYNEEILTFSNPLRYETA